MEHDMVRSSAPGPHGDDGTQPTEGTEGTERDGRDTTSRGPTSEEVWRHVTKASFAVISQVTPAGECRSSGVLYKTIGRRLFVVTAPESFKARHIAANGHVAMTVPVRRGGLLSLVAPIPPATINFHGVATVHPPGSMEVPEALAPLVPVERRTSSTIIEIDPVGVFLTYGIGVSLMKMRDPALALTRVPVDGSGAAS